MQGTLSTLWYPACREQEQSALFETNSCSLFAQTKVQLFFHVFG